MSDQKPLLVQSDHSLLLEVHHPACEACRADIAPFTELEKSPEHIHTYRMSPLSLWNAASAGLSSGEILGILDARSRYPVPDNVRFFVTDILTRWGLFQLDAGPDADTLVLRVPDGKLRRELASQRRLKDLLRPHGDEFLLPLLHRGTLKKEMLTLGYPVQDLAPLKEGDPLEVALKPEVKIRDYQKGAADGVLGRGQPGTGFGTIVLPCGSGKTVVGLEVLTRLKTNTLVLTTNVAAVHQWIDELLDKTDLTEDDIGEYTGDRKVIRPVTVATYQVLVWRDDRNGDYPHFRLFRERNWGLIVYDEVHLLPAPVFRVTAELQAVRRVGLTATLVREDGAEGEVFSLVGPKRYDVPWKELEAKGWIAEARCTEIRLELPEDLRIPYAVADKREKFRIASENPLKEDVVAQLVANHREDAILVIGQYIGQLEKLAKMLKAPLITGSMPNAQREVIYEDFRQGKVRVIVVSKVANFAINLPDASMAIQVSGTFGSRQEEAQRLGRILRPKQRNALFYTIVSRATSEEEYSAHRQKFLTEQGYKYSIEVF